MTRVGVVGGDAPRQLMLAAGVTPIRLVGSWAGPISEPAQSLLGSVDAVVARILTEIIDGEHDDLDGIVVCNDSQANLRLFYVLRVRGGAIPVLLLDMPHQDSAGARDFARFQLERLIAFCEQISGERVSGESLAAAASRERLLSRSLAGLRSRRCARPPRVDGVKALDAYRAALQTEPEQAVQAVEAARSIVAEDAVRVHVTGSSQPDASFYAVIEAGGAVIASDDHELGDAAWFGAVIEGGSVEDVIDGMVDAHMHRDFSSATATIASRAELTARTIAAAGAEAIACPVREHDDAPAWDLAASTSWARAEGLPLVVALRIGAQDSAAVAAAIAADVISAVGGPS